MTIAACTVACSARHRFTSAEVCSAGTSAACTVVGVPSNLLTDIGRAMRASGSGGVSTDQFCTGPKAVSSMLFWDGGTGSTGSASPLSTARTSLRAMSVAIPSPTVWSKVRISADRPAFVNRTARINGAIDLSMGSTKSSIATACQPEFVITRSGTGAGSSTRQKSRCPSGRSST